MKQLLYTSLIVAMMACNNQSTSTPNDSTTANETAAADSVNTVSMDATQLLVTHLENYFLSNKVQKTGAVQCWVVQTKEEFDELFGAAKTNNNVIINPDFNTQFVVALAVPATDTATTITLSNGIKSGNNADLRFTITKGQKQSFTMSPVWLGTVEKTTGVENVSFYDGEALVKMIPIKY
ncbi:hypothetical protein LX64_05122 [Chitinophaga skermanii]|uniref:Uncharacterized protein n=1 Tax=Chitinophaga skermanii TaxID=331697 RepID=A0A327Q152_9BACT|nr:hypothetical protein [Chitinophaga skermanii]RAI97451.1 hypothetical protein LX64_05122 [Chitinophaga skermanii]